MNVLLQPEDSKRVADALLERIAEADFDVARAMFERLSCGNGDTLGENIVEEFADLRRGLLTLQRQHLEHLDALAQAGAKRGGQ